MRIHLSVAAAAALSLGLVPHALAQAGDAPPATAGPKYNIMGPSSCAGWPKSGSITSASKAVPLNWALGFVSGQATQSNIALLETVDPEAMDKWLTSYCRDHPTDTLPVAVRALQRDLEAKLPAPVQAKADEPPMFFTPPPKPAVQAASKPTTKATAKKRATPRKATARAKPKPAG